LLKRNSQGRREGSNVNSGASYREIQSFKICHCQILPLIRD